MVGAGVFNFPIVGYGAVIVRTTLSGTGVYTLGGAVSHTLFLVMSITPLDLHQVCSVGLETGLQVFLVL